MNPRETPQCFKKMTIGAWIILGPTGHSLCPISSCAVKASVRRGRVHQAAEGEFRLLLIIGGERKTAVPNGRVFAEGHLEGTERSGQHDCRACQHKAP